MSYPTVSDNPRVQAAYEAMRERGESHNMAEALALRQFPGVKGDAVEALKGLGTRDPLESVPKAYRELVRKRCKERGIDLNGKRYLGSLANTKVNPFAGPGEPILDERALVDSRSEAKRVVEERGWSCEGMANVKGVDRGVPVEDKPYRVAPDIVENRIAAIEEEHPEWKPSAQERSDVSEKLTAQFSGAQD